MNNLSFARLDDLFAEFESTARIHGAAALMMRLDVVVKHVVTHSAALSGPNSAVQRLAYVPIVVASYRNLDAGYIAYATEQLPPGKDQEDATMMGEAHRSNIAQRYPGVPVARGSWVTVS